MAKFFKTSDEIAELIETQFNESGLATYGLNLKIMSTNKSKDLMTVSKESAKTEFLSKSNDLISVIVNESIFERLSASDQKILCDTYLSCISYDSEKDKINVDKNQINLVLNGRRKYGDEILNKFELVQTIAIELEEEEKERKMAEKEAKKARKNNQ